MKFLLTLLLLGLAEPLFAADANAPAKSEAPPVESSAFEYAPEHCEFSTTFPQEPYITERCEKDNSGKCYQQVSYTQVYDMASTVNVRVICNKADAGLYEQYSNEVVQATLRAMTQNHVKKTFKSALRQEKNYKQAGLVGEGMVGQTPTLYIAQLWIGQKSVMSVEAELIGDAHDEADALFANILRSIHYRAEHRDTEPRNKAAAKAKPEKSAEDQNKAEKPAAEKARAENP